MKSSGFLLGATLMVGIAGGYVVGSRVSSSEGSSRQLDEPVRTRSSLRSESTAPADSTARRSRGVKDMAEIERIPGASNRVQAMMTYYESLNASQLESEARGLDDLPLSERMMASLLLFARWGEVDPMAAMTHANSMGFNGMFVRPAALQSWASVDPANAAKYFAENPREFAGMGMGRGPMGNQGASSIIAGEWAKQDPASALAWVKTLSQDKEDALASVMREVAKKDPAGAASMVAGMAAADSSSSYRTIAEYYGANNFAEAKVWIQSLPADQQAAAMSSAISGLAKTNPQLAASQVSLLQDGDAKNRAVVNLVGVMARDNPQAAVDFMGTNGSEQAQRDSMRELIPVWVSKDPNAALGYAANLPQGSVRDSALQNYVFSNRSAEPVELLRVAETIGDNRDRSRSVGMTAARWMQEDPSAAKSYIQQSPDISADMKEHLLNGGSFWGRGGRGR